MERIFKLVRIGNEAGRAVIDTGTQITAVPRCWAEGAGILRGKIVKKRAELRIGGHKPLKGSTRRTLVHIVGGKCSARVEVFVPDEGVEWPWPFALVGSRYLQEVGAAIVYQGDHPIICEPRTSKRNPASWRTGITRKASGVTVFESLGNYPDPDEDSERVKRRASRKVRAKRARRA